MATDLVPITSDTPAPESSHELTVAEKITGLVERRPEAFLSEEGRRVAKAAPPPPAPATLVPEEERRSILANVEMIHRDFASACDYEAAMIRQEVAKLQRDWATIAPLLAVDPVEGNKRKAELMEVQAELMHRDAILSRNREYLVNCLFQCTEVYLWGHEPGAMERRNKELPELVKWGKAQGMSADEILLAGQSPSVAWGLYQAWKGGRSAGLPKVSLKTGKPVQQVPRPTGAKPMAPVSKRRTGGRTDSLDDRLGEALIRGLRR